MESLQQFLQALRARHLEECVNERELRCSKNGGKRYTSAFYSHVTHDSNDDHEKALRHVAAAAAHFYAD